MLAVGVIEAVAPSRPMRRQHIGRVAVDQLPAVEVEPGQEVVGAAVVQLDRIVAAEAVDRPAVEIDADVAKRRRVALHDRPAAEMGLQKNVNLALLRLTPPAAPMAIHHPVAPGTQTRLGNRHRPSVHLAISGHLRSVHSQALSLTKLTPSEQAAYPG